MSWCADPNEVAFYRVHDGCVLPGVIQGLVVGYLCLTEYATNEDRTAILRYFNAITFSDWIRESYPPYHVTGWRWSVSQLQAWKQSFESNAKLVLWSRKCGFGKTTIALAILERWRLETGIAERVMTRHYSSYVIHDLISRSSVVALYFPEYEKFEDRIFDDVHFQKTNPLPNNRILLTVMSPKRPTLSRFKIVEII